MRRVAGSLIGITGLLAVAGCSGGSPADPATSAALPPSLAPGLTSGQEAILGRYRLHVEPDALSVTVEPIRVAQRQGFVFDLDIANFMETDTFKISGVTTDIEGDLEVEFTHAHPFPAPNFSLPISAQNRADLGYTGRLVILADAQSSSFLSGNVLLDPTGIKDPDGFLRAGPVLADETLTNNTFPYVLLADESKDNRVGVSNGGSMTGNYDAAGGGWHRGNIGANNDGWTGFDFVHQGQRVINSFTMRPEALGVGAFDVDVAIVIKYVDPRGGSGAAVLRSNRFPPATPDYTRFAYRLPHAALDNSVVKIENRVEVTAAADGCTQVDFNVRDWDSYGVEGADLDLSDDPDLSSVAPGSNATPSVDSYAPFLSAGSSSAVLTNFGTGGPGSELEMGVKLYNELGTVSAGRHYAALYVQDPEDGTDASYHFGVDPLLLTPDRLAIASTFQVVAVDVTAVPLGQSLPPEFLGSPCEDGGQGGGPATFQAPPVANGATNYDWDFGGGATPNTATGASPAVTYTSVDGIYTGFVTATNAFGTSNPLFFTFTVGNPTPNSPLQMTVEADPAFISSGTTAQVRITALTSAAPPAQFQVDWNADGDYSDSGEGLLPASVGTANDGPVTYANNGSSTATVVIPYRYQDAAEGPFQRTTSVLVLPAPAPGGWARALGDGGTEFCEAVNIDDAGNVVVAGAFDAMVDFGGGIRAFAGGNSDIFVVKYDRNGNYLWDYTSVVVADDETYSLDVDNQGRIHLGVKVVASGPWGYGGPPTFGAGTYVSLLVLNPDGSYWADTTYGVSASFVQVQTIDVGPDGYIDIGGFISGTYNLGGPIQTTDGQDGFIWQLDPTRTPDWDVVLGGNGAADDYCFAVTRSPSGDVYAVGSAESSVVDFGSGQTNSNGWSDAYVAKFDSNGSCDWTRLIGTVNYDVAEGGVFNEVTNQIVLSGVAFEDTDFGGGPRTYPPDGTGLFVAAYSPSNTYAWDWIYPTTGEVGASHLAVDGAGRIAVGGNYDGMVLNFGFGNHPDAGIGMFALELTGDGTPYASAAISLSLGSAFLNGVDLSSNGELALAGYYSQGGDFDPGPGVFNLTPDGFDQGFVSRLRSNLRW